MDRRGDYPPLGDKPGSIGRNACFGPTTGVKIPVGDKPSK